jgi:hypothetical protein
MQNRSDAGRAGLAVLLCLTIALAGCSLDWIGEGEEIVAVLIPATTNLVALVEALEGKTVSTADVQLIQSAGTQAGADLQLIQALIAAYQKADAAAQPGILSQIQTAIGTVQANLEGLLPALHIKDAATQAKITAVVGVLLAEVQSLAAMVPGSGGGGQGPQNPQVSQNRRDLGHPGAISGHPKPALSAREFVASYNATLAAKTGNADLDRATTRLKIHEHGKLERWATAGMVR